MPWATLCLGVVVCAVLPNLSIPYLFLACAVLLLLAVLFRSCRVLIYFVFGLVYALWRFQDALNSQVPVNFPNDAMTATVHVKGVISQAEMAQVFRAEVKLPQQTFQVQAYDYHQHTWRVGEVWQCSLRLRAPIGMVNAAGFNSEQWALAQGLDGRANIGKDCLYLGEKITPTVLINRLRFTAWQRLQQLDKHHPQGKALVAALSIGLQDGLDDDTWQAFRRLGVVHLVSISGVHVTMLAVLMAWLMGKLLRVLPWQVKTPLLWRVWSGVIIAFVYALIAGFEVPTQRTVWMLLVFALMLSFKLMTSVWTVWVVALSVVLLIQPTAVLSIGLWLSFGLVAVMIWAEQSRRQLRRQRWLMLFRVQIAALLLTVVWVGAYFHSVPIFSSLANSVAIPLFSWVLTPLALLASVLPWDTPLVWVVALAQWSVDVSVWAAPYSPQLNLAQAPWYLNGLGTLAAAVMLLPHALALRMWSALVLLLLVCYQPPPIKHGQLRVQVIDVGQGLALLLQTKEHDLLFDTGRGNAHTVLLPVLQARGISQLDALVLSHNDVDHDGAAEGLLASMQAQTVWVGKTEAYPQWQVAACHGSSWQWDGVWFEWLTLPNADAKAGNNAKSCVLRVVTNGQALLIPADIGIKQEQQLLNIYGDALHSTALILGHHGSSSSNGSTWLNAINPDVAIASSGWRNAYQHPTPVVQTRLSAHEIALHRTDTQGSLEIIMDDELHIQPFTGRLAWWQRKPFK